MMNRLIPIFLTVALAACGGSNDSSLLGSWGGSWTSNGGATGTVQTTFTEDDGSHFEGSIQFSGSPCFSGAAITGDVDGSDVVGEITAGGIALDYDATIEGTSMNGTYTAVAAGVCTGDTGTFSLDKR